MESGESISFASAMASWNRRCDDKNYSPFFKSIRDVECAESCLAIGMGGGLHEIDFIQQSMPNLKRLLAVDPEAKSHEELKLNLSTLLPNLKYELVQSRIEDWEGPSEPVDAVLAFGVLSYYLDETERQKIYQKCTNSWTNANGKLVISMPDEDSLFSQVSLKLWPEIIEPNSKSVVNELKSWGYTVEKIYNFRGKSNLSDLDDDFLWLFTLGRSHVDLDVIRQCVKLVAPEEKGNWHTSVIVVGGRCSLNGEHINGFHNADN